MSHAHSTRRNGRNAAGRSLGLLGLLAGLASASAAGRAAELVETPAQVPLRVEVIESTPEAVRYQITNAGPNPVRDVEVLVTHAFHWNAERAPGTHSPSRAAKHPVPGELAPQASTLVTYLLAPPLENRTDGRFDVDVEVLRWTTELPPPR